MAGLVLRLWVLPEYEISSVLIVELCDYEQFYITLKFPCSNLHLLESLNRCLLREIENKEALWNYHSVKTHSVELLCISKPQETFPNTSLIHYRHDWLDMVWYFSLSCCHVLYLHFFILGSIFFLFKNVIKVWESTLDNFIVFLYSLTLKFSLV